MKINENKNAMEEKEEAKNGQKKMWKFYITPHKNIIIKFVSQNLVIP